jgi:low temperature requirement protein LtrA
VSTQPAETEQTASPLELFFDLVFVFGFTQVTTLLSAHPTWTGVGHALLILSAIWWAWAAYAWLTNTIDADVGFVLAAILVGAGAMFIAALAVPEAFGNEGVAFGVAFLIVNVVQAALYVIGAGTDRALLAAIARSVPWVTGGSLLILAAGFAHSTLRTILWILALIVGFVGPTFVGVQGWRVRPAHFVERHGLIVIIAIGESLVAIGIGARGEPLDGGLILSAVLGLIVVVSFWLAYFDFFQIRGRQLLTDRSGPERIALARDAYTYLHLPMVAGIVLFSFALKSTLAHRADELSTVKAVALCGGPALYLAAYVALRVRVSRTLGRGRPVAAIACTALIPVALHVPAIVALALVAGVWVALHAYELIWYREARAEAHVHQRPIET